MKVLARSLATLVAVGLSVSAYAALSDKQRAEIEERIAPVGQVCMEGDSECGAAVASSDGGGAKSGEEVFNASCTACHSTGAGGAPKIGDEGAWDERLTKGIEEVYANAINGLGGMPPKGTCMNCSDDEIKAAVDYIVDESD